MIVLDLFRDADCHHFLLVIIEFVRICGQNYVSNEDLLRAEKLLSAWLKCVPVYLDYNAYTFNVHCLNHLPEQIRQFGCTWSINAAVFESWLGWVKKLNTGTTNILSVIMRRFVDYKTVSLSTNTCSKVKNGVQIIGSTTQVTLGEIIFYTYLKHLPLKV